MPTLSSIHVSRGGVPKLPIARAHVSASGVEGDAQADLRHHGGPRRAVCLYSADVIDALRAEGHPIAPGTTGENLTIRGLDWAALASGTRLRVGADCVLEITDPVTPCAKIAASFTDRDISRVLPGKHPGWSRLYARVLAEGEVRPGDAVEIVTR